MAIMRSTSQFWLAAIAGVLSHLTYFIRGEHHLHAARIVEVYIGLGALTFLSAICNQDTEVTVAVLHTVVVAFSYGGPLFCSILVYRMLFHRLHPFPGPPMARASKLWNVFKAAKSTNFRLMEDLHWRYGDFVRTGPNEITVFKPEVVKAIDGVGSKCSKAAWYDIMQPRVSIATTRDKDLHRRRRRIWESAFRPQALQDYEPRLVYFAEQLHRRLDASNEGPLDVSFLFYLYAFDVMSDLAFGEPLDMLESDENHFTVGLLQDGMGLLGPLSPVPWLVRVGLSIPGVARNFKSLLEWSAQKLRHRIAHEPSKRDVMSWLLKASRDADSMEQDQHWLRGDGFALIVAGSDTVASTLISIFYHIADDPSHLEKLRAELKAADSVQDQDGLRAMMHLNGMIHEALRLHPALPSGGLRETPAEGLTIAGHYIPGNVVVSAPRYSLGRLESCYERADEFVPERWYAKPEMIKDDSGFSPFSQGRHNCIGKNLAMMQIRGVVALIVTHFDVKYAPHEDGIRVWRDLKDQFNSHPGKLELVFSPREHG